MKKEITQDRMEDALAYLADTDESAAIAKASVARAEYRAEHVKDAIFLRSEGSAAERNAISKTHAEYVSAMDKYFEALEKAEFLKNKRATECVVVEAWRSLNAARRQGQ